MPRRQKTDPAPPRPRRWASRQKTAEHLGVAERTVTSMATDGRITAYRLGRTVRFDLNEIDDAMLPFGGAVE
jgi:excisionase family DNA binding protein